jgi:hypothetical protein
MNTQTQEALKMAIEAMEYNIEWYNIGDTGIDKSEEAINACKEALDTEQVRKDARDKEFVTLTDDEVHQLHRQHSLYKPTIRKIEAMLKEKNT